MVVRLRELEPRIHITYFHEGWPRDLVKMLETRYNAVESRLVESYQFVDVHQDNRNTFSAGYASILRDACSAYSSTCDRLVRVTGFVDSRTKETSAADYRAFLIKVVPEIAVVCVQLEYPYGEKYLMPFDSLRDDESPRWWSAFTNLKHTEFDNITEANLSNCLNATAGLAVLVRLLDYTIEVSSLVGVPPQTKFQVVCLFQLALLLRG